MGRNSAAFANTIGVCLLKYKEIEVSEQYWPIRGLQLQLYQFLLENLALLCVIFNYILKGLFNNAKLIDHLISDFNELALHF